MPVHAYPEDQRVEQPAIGLFAELGWTTVFRLKETWRGQPRRLAHGARTSRARVAGSDDSRDVQGDCVLAVQWWNYELVGV